MANADAPPPPIQLPGMPIQNTPAAPAANHTVAQVMPQNLVLIDPNIIYMLFISVVFLGFTLFIVWMMIGKPGRVMFFAALKNRMLSPVFDNDGFADFKSSKSDTGMLENSSGEFFVDKECVYKTKGHKSTMVSLVKTVAGTTAPNVIALLMGLRAMGFKDPTDILTDASLQRIEKVYNPEIVLPADQVKDLTEKTGASTAELGVTEQDDVFKITETDIKPEAMLKLRAYEKVVSSLMGVTGIAIDPLVAINWQLNHYDPQSMRMHITAEARRAIENMEKDKGFIKFAGIGTFFLLFFIGLAIFLRTTNLM